ncbi:hypothetical protein JXM67_05360 [candidate division WOR-3 bacterium]|nr:hypothetical protein [candidate division WOR-3 bacterium]
MVGFIFLLLGSLLVPREETLILEPGRTSYLVFYPSVIQGTVEIQGFDSGWSIRNDTLFLQNPPAETLIVTIKYATLSEEILTPYQEHEPRFRSLFSQRDSIPEKNKLTREDLSVHGAKTFSLSVNEGGNTELDQGLAINASGELGGVEIEAYLNDEEGSFAPEGTTERIEEFDRILVGLTQDNWELRLGDLDLVYPLTGYGTIDRRLQGGIGKVSFNSFEANAALGIDGTRREHIVLVTEDGKQGPYYISQVQSEQPVVPGSEKVYLDGRLLEPGLSRDYTIDYLTGEMVFNNRTRIDAGSRIEVDYTYQDADYRSDNELAALKAGPLTATFYREADSRTHFFHTWSAEQEGILDTVTGSQAILPGARLVGEGFGSYVFQDNQYVWVGQDGGDYEVSFRYVEPGDYVLDADSGFFRYVGPDSGNYLPEILTPLPQQEEVIALSLEQDIGKFSIGLIGIGSRTTPNLYNQEYKLWGHAHRIRTSFANDELEIGITHRLQTPEVWIPADGEDADAADRWGRDSMPLQFNEQNVEVTVKPLDSLFLTGQAGHLWDKVHEFRAGFQSSAPFYHLAGDWLSDRQRVYLGLHPRIGIFIPQASFNFENYNSLSARNLEPLAGLLIVPVSGFRIGVTASRRIDQRKTNSWQDTLYYDRIGSTLDWETKKLTVSASAGLERLIPVDSPGWQSMYADLFTTYNPNSRIRLSANFSQHLASTRTEVVEYLPVEPGTGGYIRDPETGEYVPAEEGDYRREVRTVVGETLEVERRASLGTDISLKKIRVWASASYLDAATVNSLLASSRISFFPTQDKLNLILNPSFSRQRFPAWGGFKETLEGWGVSAEIRSRVHPDYMLRLKGSYDTEEKTRSQSPLRSRQDYSIELAPLIEVWLKLEPVVGFGTLIASEPFYYPELGEITIRKVWIGTDAEKRFGEWRVSAGILLTSRQANVPAEDLPYLITQDDPSGFHPSWKLDLERSFGKSLMLRASYEGNLYPDDRGLTSEFELSAGMYF